MHTERLVDSVVEMARDVAGAARFGESVGIRGRFGRT